MEPQKWDERLRKAEALKAAVDRVKILYSPINATPLHVALLYHRLPVIRFQVCRLYSTVGSCVKRWRTEDSWQWRLR
jgi:hypothetical protein